jgi:hypothetical protein
VAGVERGNGGSWRVRRCTDGGGAGTDAGGGRATPSHIHGGYRHGGIQGVDGQSCPCTFALRRHGGTHVCKTRVPKPVWSSGDTFSKFRDLKNLGLEVHGPTPFVPNTVHSRNFKTN